MKTIVYCRYSSTLQDASHSIEAQLRVVRDFVGREFSGEEIEEVVDRAKSGTTIMGRPGYVQILERARAGEEFRLAVYKFDRIGRNFGESVRSLSELESLGVSVVSATEGSNPLVRNIMLAVADDYSKQLGERSREGMVQNALEGNWNGGRPPYGFELVKVPDPSQRKDKYGKPLTRTQLKVVPQKAEVVREVFEARARGHGLKRIARDLNASQRPTYSGNVGAWDPSAVRAILHNPIYLGSYVFNRRKMVRKPDGKRVSRPRKDSEWRRFDLGVQVVTQELWDKVRSRDQHHDKFFPVRKNLHLLTGLAKCSLCGANFVVTSSARDGYRHHYFRCGWHYRRGPEACKASCAIPMEEVERKVIASLEENLFTSDNVRFLEEETKRFIDRALKGEPREAKRAEQEIAGLRDQVGRLTQVIAEGGGDSPALLTALREKEAKLRELEASATARSQVTLSTKIKDLGRKIRERVGKTLNLLKAENREILRDELREHIDALVVHPDGKILVHATLFGLLSPALPQGVGLYRGDSGGRI